MVTVYTLTLKVVRVHERHLVDTALDIEVGPAPLRQAALFNQVLSSVIG